MRVFKAGAGIDDAGALQAIKLGEVGGAQLGNEAVFGLHGGAEHGGLVGFQRAAFALGNEFFGRDAAHIDAGAAVHLGRCLGQENVLPVLGQISGQRFASLAKADNEIGCVQGLHEAFLRKAFAK